MRFIIVCLLIAAAGYLLWESSVSHSLILGTDNCFPADSPHALEY